MLDKVTQTDPGEDQTPIIPAPSKKAGTKARVNLWAALRPFLQIILMIAIIAASAIGAWQMIKNKPAPKKRPAFKTVYTVDTIVAQTSDNQPSFISYGETVAARTVDLRSLVSGEIVSINPNLRNGARVEQGAVLVSIDPFNFEGALSEARANLAEAEAGISEIRARISLERAKLDSAREQLLLAEADLERAEKLKASGSSTQQQLDNRRLIVSQRKQAITLSEGNIAVESARLEQRTAALDRLRWRVKQADKNLQSTELVAPFTGIVKLSNAEIGRMVNANDVAVSLYEEGSLEVRFTLSDAQFGRVSSDSDGVIGRKVDVAWSVGGQSAQWEGEIDRLGAEITSNRGGIEVYAKLKPGVGGQALRPGAFVEVRIPDTKYPDSFSVPDTALYGGDTIYVVVDGKLAERKVDVSAFDGETAIITGGIQAGDQILVTRISEVSAGLRVRREETATGSEWQTSSANQPDRAEMKAILEKAGISLEDFRALSSEEKRNLVAKHRNAAN